VTLKQRSEFSNNSIVFHSYFVIDWPEFVLLIIFFMLNNVKNITKYGDFGSILIYSTTPSSIISSSCRQLNALLCLGVSIFTRVTQIWVTQVSYWRFGGCIFGASAMGRNREK